MAQDLTPARTGAAPTYGIFRNREDYERFHEMATRGIALDYAAFFRKVHLSESVREAALQILTDAFDSDDEEKVSYDELLRKLLGDELFRQLAEYRRQIPVMKQVDEGVAALHAATPAVPEEEVARVKAALAAIPAPNPLALEAVNLPKITDEDIARVRAAYAQAFDRAFAAHPVSPDTRAALQDWYLGVKISSQMRVILTQQQIQRAALGRRN